MAVEPAALSFDAHGAPMSERYGDVYASRDGALGQARHVFLGGTRCLERWRGRSQFVILETGFGLGINFLAAWFAWRADDRPPDRLHFVSMERHPLPAASVLDAAPDELKPLAAQLAAQWPRPMAGLHRCEFEHGRVVLTLAFGDARTLAPQLVAGADAIFLDGFAPDRNPEMWEPALLRAVARLARSDARLATWSIARPVRDALQSAGFDVALAPGFGHKRQMLTAHYRPRYVVRRYEPPGMYAGPRDAIVVGGGLAGAACAHALARRGWRVTAIESARPAAGASALPWGSMHPHFAVDDNLLARLTRAGSAATLFALRSVAPNGDHADEPLWRATGMFQQAADAEEAQRWRAALDRLHWPDSYVQWMDASAARERLGVRPARSGLWWPDAVVLSAARWVHALQGDGRIAVLNATVGALQWGGSAWHVLGTDGARLASAPVVVVAAACDTPRLLTSTMLPVQPVPGQVTFVEAPALATLRAALGGDGTLLRTPDGRLAVGATYETPHAGSRAALDERMAARSNLARLERLLAEPVEARAADRYTGVRCVSRDRLPYAGAAADEGQAVTQAERLRGAQFEDLPRHPHLYASFALGSRGLTFAPLAAELIAARIEGEPAPLERDLLNALDPGRVLLRCLRKGAVRPLAAGSSHRASH